MVVNGHRKNKNMEKDQQIRNKKDEIKNNDIMYECVFKKRILRENNIRN